MKLELEYCWGLGLPLKVPILGLEDAHRFAILSMINVPLGTGGMALLPALKLWHCSDSVVTDLDGLPELDLTSQDICLLGMKKDMLFLACSRLELRKKVGNSVGLGVAVP
jgi:hypothetical protein